MENIINERESLKIINEMISQARNNFQSRSANTTIIAGYTVAIVAVATYVLMQLLPQPAMANHLWWIMLPMGILLQLAGRRQDRGAIVKTHIDIIIGKIWRAFFYSTIITMIVIFGSIFAIQNWSLAILITPFILIMTGLAQYITGSVCRFRPYTIGGYIFWIGALLSVASYFTGSGSIQLIILAVVMILGFVIPGYKAKKKGE